MIEKRYRMNKKLMWLWLCMIGSLIGQTQSLSDHQWKNRILVIHADSDEDPVFRNQIDSLAKHVKELSVRKILIYQVSNGQYRNGLSLNTEWKKVTSPSFILRGKNSPIEITLIGLDGGVKLKLARAITIKELIATIDSMPMRRAEIRKKE